MERGDKEERPQMVRPKPTSLGLRHVASDPRGYVGTKGVYHSAIVNDLTPPIGASRQRPNVDRSKQDPTRPTCMSRYGTEGKGFEPLSPCGRRFSRPVQ